VEDAARAFVGDHLEMVGFAAHHGTERHQGVVAPAGEPAALERERLQRERDLERAGHAHDIDVRRGHAELHELAIARGEQLAHDLLVEPAPDHADAKPLPVQLRLRRLLHTAFTATASSGETYSTTSRPN